MTFTLTRLALNVSIALSCLVQGAAQASTPAELNEAIAAYNAKNYALAISRLEKVSPANAKHPYTRYYRGLCYQALRRFDDAEREFRWNYDNSKDADIRYKSWQALEALSKLKTHSGTGTSASTGTSTDSRTQAQSQTVSTGGSAAGTSRVQWGSASTLDKKGPVYNASDYETIIDTPRSCGR